MLKAIHASESRTAAEATAERVRTRLEEMNLSKLGQWIAATVGETLTYHAFPSAWYKIGTNNPLERLLREIRRRTGVVGTFPDGESALNLAGTSAVRCRHRMVDAALSQHGVAQEGDRCGRVTAPSSICSLWFTRRMALRFHGERQ
jgi:transposase-like protein